MKFRISCINCGSQDNLLLIQASVIEKGELEEIFRTPICRECLAEPVNAMTLAREIREAE